MKDDFVRKTFKKKKHYHEVNKQQGRVQLDADWNEQRDILFHHNSSVRTHNMRTEEVVEVVLEIAQSLRNCGLMLNERYLHHFFSHRLQTKQNLLNLTGDRDAINLHPEWPTYKTQTKLRFGQYRKRNRRYHPDVNGTAGFIDFAIGNYHRPDIGIEFTLKFGWSQEEIIYDFLKLLDPENPFKTAISLNVILRHGRLVRGESLRNLEKQMNSAFPEATERLKIKSIDVTRELYFVITEIAKDNSRRHWHYDQTSSKFKKGLPSSE